jgi:hypothetical protein
MTDATEMPLGEYETFDLPEMPVDPDIEYETPDSPFDDPEMAEMVRRAELGIYDTTLLQMWESVIDGTAHACEVGVTIPMADGVLRQWPWLSYMDLPKYLRSRYRKLAEAKTVMRMCYPEDKDIEELFAESEDDWNRHKDIYLDIIVAWQRLGNAWVDQWDKIALNNKDKGIEHAVVADLNAFLTHPQNGLSEQIRNLANFAITDEEIKSVNERVLAEVDDE